MAVIFKVIILDFTLEGLADVEKVSPTLINPTMQELCFLPDLRPLQAD